MKKIYSGITTISLRNLHYYFFAFYVLLCLIIVGYFYQSYKNFFANKRNAMELVSYKIMADTVNIFDRAELSLNVIGDRITFLAKNNKDISEILLSAGKTYNQTVIKHELSTGKFYWINQENRLIANSENGLINDPVNLSSRDYLHKTAKAPRKIHVGAAIIGASSGEYVIPAGVGVEDKIGHYIGTLAISFKVADLQAQNKKTADKYKVNYALLDENNNIIFESKKNVFTKDKDLFKDLIKSNLKAADQFIAPFSLRKRENSFVVLQSSDKYHYRFLVGFENDFLIKQLILKIAFFVIQILLATILFVLSINYTKRSVR